MSSRLPADEKKNHRRWSPFRRPQPEREKAKSADPTISHKFLQQSSNSLKATIRTLDKNLSLFQLLQCALYISISDGFLTPTPVMPYFFSKYISFCANSDPLQNRRPSVREERRNSSCFAAFAASGEISSKGNPICSLKLRIEPSIAFALRQA